MTLLPRMRSYDIPGFALILTSQRIMYHLTVRSIRAETRTQCQGEGRQCPFIRFDGVSSPTVSNSSITSSGRQITSWRALTSKGQTCLHAGRAIRVHIWRSARGQWGFSVVSKCVHKCYTIKLNINILIHLIH